MGDNILSDFGINLLEEEIDDVIFQTNEFLCDATFTGTQGPFWWILQMCMALAALFSLIVAGQMAFKMMYKNVLVVSAGRQRDKLKRLVMVRARLPLIYTELDRLIYA